MPNHFCTFWITTQQLWLVVHVQWPSTKKTTLGTLCWIGWHRRTLPTVFWSMKICMICGKKRSSSVKRDRPFKKSRHFNTQPCWIIMLSEEQRLRCSRTDGHKKAEPILVLFVRGSMRWKSQTKYGHYYKTFGKNTLRNITWWEWRSELTITISEKRIVAMRKRVMMMTVWFCCQDRKPAISRNLLNWKAISRNLLNQIAKAIGFGWGIRDGV